MVIGVWKPGVSVEISCCEVPSGICTFPKRAGAGCSCSSAFLFSPGRVLAEAPPHPGLVCGDAETSSIGDREVAWTADINLGVAASSVKGAGLEAYGVRFKFRQYSG
jgi:hypothetical protein